MQKMRAAGVNVFPAEDSFKYVKILDKVVQVYSLLQLAYTFTERSNCVLLFSLSCLTFRDVYSVLNFKFILACKFSVESNRNMECQR